MRTIEWTLYLCPMEPTLTPGSLDGIAAQTVSIIRMPRSTPTSYLQTELAHQEALLEQSQVINGKQKPCEET